MKNPIHLLFAGQRLPEVLHEGNHFIMAPAAGEYQIEIDMTDHHGSHSDNPRCIGHHLAHRKPLRYEVVLSVDGLSIMDGKPASASGNGYISDVSSSYSDLMGHGAKNVGIIGAAVYVEDVPVREPGAGILRGARAKSPLEAMSLSAVSHHEAPTVGTGFGDATDFHTHTVNFKRGDRLGVFTLHYRTRDWLQRAGVPIPGESPLGGSAFPADSGCAPPPGWRPRS